MNIEVGQWVRTAYGLDRVIRIDDEIENTCGLIHLNDSTFYNFYTENGKIVFEDEMSYQVANTPQELIQVGDLVGFGDTGLVEITNDVLSRAMLDNHSNKITKILTSNKDKSVYTEQWKEVK